MEKSQIMNREFAIELLALLEKYNATIEWAFDDSTDMHGIYGEKIVIMQQPESKPLLKMVGMEFGGFDLKQILKKRVKA